MTKEEIVKAVREHALTHYSDGGWDTIVECYEDEDILKLVGNARTIEGALKKMKPIIDAIASRDREMEAMRNW